MTIKRVKYWQTLNGQWFAQVIASSGQTMFTTALHADKLHADAEAFTFIQHYSDRS